MVMLFSSVNTLKIILLSGLVLVALWINVSAAHAQTQAPTATTDASSSQQSEATQNPLSTTKPDQKSLNSTQKQSILDALYRLNDKYKTITQDILIAPLLKDPSKRFKDGEELIFAVIIDNLKLGELFTYKHKQGLRLGLNEFSTALDFAITANPEQTQYSGWFIKEANPFTLTISKSPDEKMQSVTVDINGEQTQLQDNEYQIEFDDIYINGDVLAEWFGLTLEYDFVNLKCILSSASPLPVQLRYARKNNKINKGSGRQAAQFTAKDADYQLLSPQAMDVVLNASHGNSITSLGYSALGARDLAFMRSEFFLRGSNQSGLESASLNFSRKALSGSLFNTGITEIEIGDVQSVRGGLSSTGGLSRGIALTNRSNNSEQDINVTTLQGPIQTDWDVELYRNGILIERLIAVDTGRYEFTDIPLFYGKNTFELKFFGPQGQVDSKIIERLVTQTLQSKKGLFGLSLTDLDNSMLNIDQLSTDTKNGSLLSSYYEQSLTPLLAIRAGYENRFGGDTDLQLFNVGLNTQWLNQVLMGFSFTGTDAGQQSVNASMRTSFKKHALSASVSHSQSEYIDENDIEQTNSASNLLLSASGGFALFEDVNLNYQNDFTMSTNANDITTKRLSSRFGSRLYGSNVNLGVIVNRVDDGTQSFIDEEFDDNSLDYVSGSLNVSRKIGQVDVNMQSQFDFDTWDVEQISAQLNYNITNNIKSRLTLSRNLENKTGQTSLNINWRHNSFSLSSYFNYSDILGWNSSMNIRFGMGLVDDAKTMVLNRRSLTSAGTVIALVFLDNNLNGVFDENDEPLPNVKVSAPQATRRAITNEDGFANITGLRDSVVTDIIVHRDTLPDPFMLQLEKGFAVRGRSGFIDEVSIPVTMSSEIEGNVFFTDAYENQRQLAYVTLNLVNSDGEVVQSISSEYDGYYLFLDILPGDYHIEVDDEYLRGRDAKPIEHIPITLSAKGDLISGVDFMLSAKQYDAQYAVTLGQFNTPDIMQTYWQILLRSTSDESKAMLNEPFFFSDDAPQQGNYLGVGLYQNKQYAFEQCNRLEQQGIACEIVTHKVEIP